MLDLRAGGCILVEVMWVGHAISNEDGSMMYVLRWLKHAGFSFAVLGSIAASLSTDAVVASPAHSITVYERSSGTLERTETLENEDDAYVPMEFLVDRLGFERKSLSTGRVGICRKDRCIPFSVGTAQGELRRVGRHEYVPVGRLAKALGCTVVWNADENDLMLDLTSRAPLAAPAVDSIVDFTLPDLADKPVALSSFRGKRVVLFAWASW